MKVQKLQHERNRRWSNNVKETYKSEFDLTQFCFCLVNQREKWRNNWEKIWRPSAWRWRFKKQNKETLYRAVHARLVFHDVALFLHFCSNFTPDYRLSKLGWDPLMVYKSWGITRRNTVDESSSVWLYFCHSCGSICSLIVF